MPGFPVGVLNHDAAKDVIKSERDLAKGEAAVGVGHLGALGHGGAVLARNGEVELAIAQVTTLKDLSARDLNLGIAGAIGVLKCQPALGIADVALKRAVVSLVGHFDRDGKSAAHGRDAQLLQAIRDLARRIGVRAGRRIAQTAEVDASGLVVAGSGHNVPSLIN